MSLLKLSGMPVYKTEKGFKYPEAIEFYERHDAMVWHKSEITLSQDIKDYAIASEEERKFITEVMRLFVQNDVMAENGYITLLRIIKPTEVQMMLASSLDRESTHIFNYANFVDTLGLPASVYTDFLEIPVMSSKTEYLDKAKVRKYEDYKAAGLSDAEVDKEFRRAVARMIAVYGGGLEGTSLMAQFAMLLMYQQQGKYPGLADIVIWSIKDEMSHVQSNSWLFRTYIQENFDIWDDVLKYEIYQAIREIVAYEHALIDYLNPPHMPNESLKRYVEYMADNALNELGMKKNWNIPKNPLPFMEDITAPILADFFSSRVSEYSKNIEGSWGDLR